MDGQLSFATLDYAGKKKRTKRDVFLAEMTAAVPWSVLEAVIAPHYPKEGPQGGRRPLRCEEARRGGGRGTLGGEGEGQTRRQADGSPACPQS
jgi:hypothetical protein